MKNKFENAAAVVALGIGLSGCSTFFPSCPDNTVEDKSPPMVKQEMCVQPDGSKTRAFYDYQEASYYCDSGEKKSFDVPSEKVCVYPDGSRTYKVDPPPLFTPRG